MDILLGGKIMNGNLLKLVIISIFRRKKEIISVLAATMIAMFFLAGVLIFQTDMYYWQMANNKQRFGDWFIIEFSSETPNEELLKHPYLEKPTQAGTAAYIYDNDWNCTDYRIGYMTDEFMRQGNITVDKGHLPQADNEIALDYNMLISLGYDMKLGITITLNTYTDTYGNESKGTTKDFVLSGILNNYTNTWIKGKQCPTVIVTKNMYEQYNNTISNVYIYRLKDFVKSTNYLEIYNGITSLGIKQIFYNASVYDYQVWGSTFIYNYMYMLIMVIGVAAITYQLIGYRGSRYDNYIHMRQLGATKGQMRMIESLENFILLVIPAMVGIVLAAFVGKVICSNIERKKGVLFYYVDSTVYIKCVIALLLTAIIQELIYIFYVKKIEKGKNISIKGVLQRKQKKANRKTKITGKNINRIVRKRFIHANGFFLNAGIRIFSLAITGVIVLCIWNTYTAYKAYQDNDAAPDFVAYPVNEDMEVKEYVFHIVEQNPTFLSSEERQENNKKYSNDGYELLKSRLVPTPSLEEYMSKDASIHISQWKIYNSAYCRNADAALTEGISQAILNDLQAVGGVGNIDYSYFESNRIWSWEGMDYDKLGLRKIINYERGQGFSKAQIKYQDKYLFATEYVKPTKKLYDRISPYLDDHMIDYEAFERGEQILVFLDAKEDGSHDDTIQVGKKIDYIATPFGFGVDKYKDSSKFKKWLDGINVSIVFEDNNSHYYFVDEHTKVGQEISFGMLIDKFKQWRVDKPIYQWCFEGRVSPCVAGVVILDDKIREEFADIIPKFGYYTALASENMAKTIMDSQTQLLGELLQEDITEEETPYQLAYNQMAIWFDLSAAYSATNNILSAYCKQAGFECVSFAEEKDQYRTRAINALLQYGITLLAAMFMDVIILMIVAKSKIEKRKDQYGLLKQIGADNSRIRKIWMAEVLREAMWCIFTLSFVLAVQWVISRKIK